MLQSRSYKQLLKISRKSNANKIYSFSDEGRNQHYYLFSLLESIGPVIPGNFLERRSCHTVTTESRHDDPGWSFTIQTEYKMKHLFLMGILRDTQKMKNMNAFWKCLLSSSSIIIVSSIKSNLVKNKSEIFPLLELHMALPSANRCSKLHLSDNIVHS